MGKGAVCRGGSEKEVGLRRLNYSFVPRMQKKQGGIFQRAAVGKGILFLRRPLSYFHATVVRMSSLIIKQVSEEKELEAVGCDAVLNQVTGYACKT